MFSASIKRLLDSPSKPSHYFSGQKFNVCVPVQQVQLHMFYVCGRINPLSLRDPLNERPCFTCKIPGFLLLKGAKTASTNKPVCWHHTGKTSTSRRGDELSSANLETILYCSWRKRGGYRRSWERGNKGVSYVEVIPPSFLFFLGVKKHKGVSWTV